MTRAERSELAALARKQARVARAGVDTRAAELAADVEAQLSAQFKAEDEAWKDVTAAANAKIDEVNQEILERCRERGVREEFSPALRVYWSSRGENATASRRAELRMLAKARIAAVKAAKAEIDARCVEVETQLLAAGLTSDAARTFLEQMPTPAELMPIVQVAELETGCERRW